MNLQTNKRKMNITDLKSLKEIQTEIRNENLMITKDIDEKYLEVSETPLNEHSYCETNSNDSSKSFGKMSKTLK